MEKFDLAAYLTGGVENIVKNILRATLKDPRESAFMLKYSLASREATKRRTMYEERGSIPADAFCSSRGKRWRPL